MTDTLYLGSGRFARATRKPVRCARTTWRVSCKNGSPDNYRKQCSGQSASSQHAVNLKSSAQPDKSGAVVKCCWVSESGYYEQDLPEDFLVAAQPVSA